MTVGRQEGQATGLYSEAAPGDTLHMHSCYQDHAAFWTISPAAVERRAREGRDRSQRDLVKGRRAGAGSTSGCEPRHEIVRREEAELQGDS